MTDNSRCTCTREDHPEYPGEPHEWLRDRECPLHGEHILIQAETLWSIWYVGPDNEKPNFDELPVVERMQWERVARAVPGAIDIPDATAGSYPTAPQGDAIRWLREKNRKRHVEGMRERSWISPGTKPYGEVVVVFEWPDQPCKTFQGFAYLIHPDGNYEHLDTSKIPEREPAHV